MTGGGIIAIFCTALSVKIEGDSYCCCSFVCADVDTFVLSFVKVFDSSLLVCGFCDVGPSLFNLPPHS